jgi:hypothetical protein
VTIFTRNRTPTRAVIYRHLTPAQLAWMKQNVEYECIGRPRPEVKFTRCGTLHGDGTFESLQTLVAVKLRSDSTAKTADSPVERRASALSARARQPAWTLCAAGPTGISVPGHRLVAPGRMALIAPRSWSGWPCDRCRTFTVADYAKVWTPRHRPHRSSNPGEFPITRNPAARAGELTSLHPMFSDARHMVGRPTPRYENSRS